MILVCDVAPIWIAAEHWQVGVCKSLITSAFSYHYKKTIAIFPFDVWMAWFMVILVGCDYVRGNWET